MNTVASKLQRILSLEVPVVVRLGERIMTVRDVTTLVPGAIIELPKTSEAELDLLVNNKVIGQGLAVKVGENFGLRITRINDSQSRLGSAANTPEQATEDARPADAANEVAGAAGGGESATNAAP